MKAEYGGDIHTRVGIMASSVTMPKYFRFCPQCLEEDLQTYGEAYWHRVHQTPGVLVCPTHALSLQNSTVTLKGFNKHEYEAASPENCPIVSEQQCYSTETLEKLRSLSKDILWLLNNKLPSKEAEWFRKRYIALLIDKGLATPIGRVHQKELLNNFIFFYGSEVLQALDSGIDYGEENNWLSSIFRKHRKSFHPIRHLLTIKFLAGSIEEFFKTDYEYQPFGKSPWLCLNAAADHYLKPVIIDLAITRCSDTKKPVGTFFCSCGMIYCRTGYDETEDDKYRIGKIKAYGHVWERKLKEFVEVEKLGLRATARQLNVDPNTIKRYVSLLKLEASWQLSHEKETVEFGEIPVNENSAVDVKFEYREKWKALQKDYPQASKTMLRQMEKAIYGWLYRNDREWLNQNSPALRVHHASKSKVDWLQRDGEILEKVKEAVLLILNCEKPTRVTISRIAKSVDLQALIEQHLDQMPLTKAYLESVAESVDDFQIRRIKWAIKQLDRLGEEVKAWKVIRLAGLKENYSDRVREMLENELKKCPPLS
ncbi:MAG TPA: TnsD family transposase [Phormidium sp.]